MVLSTILTYRNLPEDCSSLVGRPLGCGPSAEPLVVVAVHRLSDGRTQLELEELTPPAVDAGDPVAARWWGAAKQYAEAVYRRQQQPPTANTVLRSQPDHPPRRR